MTNNDQHETPDEIIEPAAVVEPHGADDADGSESIEQPAKVMRVGSMMRQLLEELRGSSLDEPGRDRLRDIYETSIHELGSALSPDLRDELGRLALPFSDDETPSAAELRVAEAQLVGWLEGLIQGIQATLFAQQMAAQQQLANVRAGLPAGQPPPGVSRQHPSTTASDPRPGTYL
ncbi:MAG: bacterial proteasome activator family protein [Acidimicrobiia bacterium]|nr:bacterial proteasome activator family protein [Acidimicrobiia bacterium]